MSKNAKNVVRKVESNKLINLIYLIYLINTPLAESEKISGELHSPLLRWLTELRELSLVRPNYCGDSRYDNVLILDFKLCIAAWMFCTLNSGCCKIS